MPSDWEKLFWALRPWVKTASLSDGDICFGEGWSGEMGTNDGDKHREKFMQAAADRARIGIILAGFGVLV